MAVSSGTAELHAAAFAAGIGPGDEVDFPSTDVYDTDALASLIAGHDALISAFNPGWTPGTQRPEMYDEQVRGTSSIIAAAKKAGIKRVLWVGGAGGLEVASGVKVIDSPDFPEWIKPGSKATSNAQLRNEQELEWTFLAPSAVLEPGQRTGKFRLGGDQLLVDAKGESRKDKAGKPIGEEFYSVAAEGEYNVVEYVWPRPGETEPSPKTSYITKAGNQVCGVGYYQ